MNDIRPTIDVVDVERWLRRFGAPYPSEEICQRVTDRLNHVRTPAQVAEWEDWRKRQAEWEEKSGDYDWPDRRWWHFDKTAAAARFLNDSLPLMAEHWEGMRATPYSGRAEQAVRTLAEALANAMEYIEFPLGRYAKSTAKTAKPWHLEAVQIVRHLRGALVAAGHNSVGETGNFTMASVVSCALEKLGYGTVLDNAVHNFLQRREKTWGLPSG